MKDAEGDELRPLVAGILGLEASELGEEDDLLAQGLDSIRLMMLVEHWRAQGLEPDYVSLAAAPRLSAWRSLLSEECEGLE